MNGIEAVIIGSIWGISLGITFALAFLFGKRMR